MAWFSVRTKHTVRPPWTMSRARKLALIEPQARGAPNPWVLALLAYWMAEGKYSSFLRVFSPRLREEILRGEREVLEHEPVLQKWDELIAEQERKRVPKDTAG